MTWYVKLVVTPKTTRLTALNFSFITLGIISSSIAGIQKWSPSSILNDKIGQTTNGLVDIHHLYQTTGGFFAFGIILATLSVLGLVATSINNRFLSLFHWISITIFANIHLMFIIMGMLLPDQINNSFQKNLNKTLIELKNTPESEYEMKCWGLLSLSRLVKCCGYYSARDLPSAALSVCCPVSAATLAGCSQKTKVSIQENFYDYLIIPNMLITILEIMVIVLTPIWTGLFSKSNVEVVDTRRTNNRH